MGNYLNTHFVSSYQKVGTFRIANGQKQGGNVASYFCLPDGQVLHVIAGPVNAATMLAEARWVVETWKMALLEKNEETGPMVVFFRKAHLDRLRLEHGVRLDTESSPYVPKLELGNEWKEVSSLLDEPRFRSLTNQGRIHVLLAAAPKAKIEQLYRVVFERILGEPISANPVVIADVSTRR